MGRLFVYSNVETSAIPSENDTFHLNKCNTVTRHEV